MCVCVCTHVYNGQTSESRLITLVNMLAVADTVN